MLRKYSNLRLDKIKTNATTTNGIAFADNDSVDLDDLPIAETQSLLSDSGSDDPEPPVHSYHPSNDSFVAFDPVFRELQEQIADSGALQPWTFQTIKWFYYPNGSIHDTTFMFAVAGELFLVILIIGWGVTLLYHPETVRDNPILPIIGYNNVCVGLDLPPALYVIAPIYTAVAYFQNSYCLITLRRLGLARASHMMSDSRVHRWKFRFIVFSHWFFFIASACFCLCFVIHPWESIRGHTRPFEVYMISRCMVNISIFFEDSLQTARKKGYRPALWVVHTYLGLLTMTSLLLPVFWELSINYHLANPKRPPLLPWELVCMFDYTWIILVAFQAHFLPDRPLVVGNTVRNRESLLNMKSMFRKVSPSAITEMSKRSSDEINITDSVVNNFVLEAKNAIQGQESAGFSIALLSCELQIDERFRQVPSMFRKSGLLSGEGKYPGVVRINVTANAVVRLSIRIQVPKNKTFEVLAENRLTGEDDDHYYIDFLLAEWFKNFFFTDLEELNAAQNLGSCSLNVGDISKKATALYHVLTNFKDFNNSVGICGKEYYGGLPFLIGETGACKWGLKPLQQDNLPPADIPGGKHQSSLWLKGCEQEAVEKLGRALNNFFNHSNEAKWEFSIQIATDGSCEVENGVAKWNETTNPYFAVGKFVIPAQPLDNTNPLFPYRDTLQFNPWNMLKAHRPLGELQRARKFVYESHGETRRTVNSIPQMKNSGEVFARCPLHGIV